MTKPSQPTALFDTLEEMPNPFRTPVRSVAHLVSNPPASALQDYQFACEFLYSYRGSPDTFSTYRRELEHFLQWCWLIARNQLAEIKREDIEAYVEFARQPPPHWIGSKNVARFLDQGGERIPNPEWRPYVSTQGEYVCSQSALQSLFSVLSSFFNFLIQENYLQANPVSQIRQKGKFLRKQQGNSQIRRLSPLQWSYVIESAELMASDDAATHERTLFIMNALFAMYLRISELVETPRWSPQMDHFRRDSEGNWWFLTVGKGNKEREISVSNSMLDALRRYRMSRGMTPLPLPGDTAPLIHIHSFPTRRSSDHRKSVV